MKYKIHFPLKPIRDIHKTKMEVFTGSLENCATVVKEGLTGFTLIKLRDIDYAFISEQWENSMIEAYRQMQDRQFREQYGEEY